MAKESSDPMAKEKAEGALWILEGKSKSTKKCLPSSSSDDDGSKGHEFISYEWDVKPTVLKIRDRLKQAGFKTWIDADDMSKYGQRKEGVMCVTAGVPRSRNTDAPVANLNITNVI